MPASQSNLIIALFLFGLGAIGSLFLRKRDNSANLWGNIFAIAGSFFGLFSAISTFSNGGFALNIPSTFPILSFSIKMDYLAAFFVFIISLIALMASIYAIGYIKHYYQKYSIGVLEFFYNTFVIGMILVVISHNALFFLIAWEIMSLASYFLVIYEKNEKKNIEAGTLYFVMTHAGTAFITLAFLLMYRSVGSFDFEIIKNNIGLIPPVTKDIIFVLALIGFGTKAGIIPFHIWLPSAHPAAPSHVSALMSGVMIKTGIYMMIRIFIDIMPAGPLWWGIAILIIGSISSLLGVLYALSEHDIKKLLAYHSIENIGIILLGLGGSLIFRSMGLNSLATISLVAALFHTLNHAVFKALLFMGAGSVIAKTHTRNIEKYGGLIKLMPYTAFFFLIGSMAISALPPFNGFASEWLTFQSLFSGIQSSNVFAQWSFITAAGALALTSGLAAACFVKVFGITFLARPRSEEAEHATESSFSLKAGMSVLALLTLVLGFLAGPISRSLAKVSESILILKETDVLPIMKLSTLSIQNSFASISMPGISIMLLVALVAISIIAGILFGRRKVRYGVTWDCGTDPSPRAEITATGFSRSIITIFKSILLPIKQIETEFHEENAKYFPKTNTVSLETPNIYKSYIYSPIQGLISRLSEYAKIIQSGNVNTYILYIFLVLVILLVTGVIR